MNAVAPIRPDESIHGSPTERAYRHAIQIHCPGCDEMEIAARCELAAIRDAAAAGAARAGDSAATVLGEVVRLSTHAVYADLTTSDLIRLRSALSFTIEAARALERVTRTLT